MIRVKKLINLRIKTEIYNLKVKLKLSLVFLKKLKRRE